MDYIRNLMHSLHGVDIIAFLVKSIVFGIIISSVATYQGFKVKNASYEIPVVVIKSVGQGFVLCFIANAIITLIYYL